MACFSSYRGVLFDLDGTTVDHFGAIYRCYVYALKALGLPPVSYEKVKSTVGGSVPITMERLIGPEHAPAATLLFEQHMPTVLYDDLFALPGATWLLRQCHEAGLTTAIFTNKSGPIARLLCTHLGFDPWLNAVIGTGDTPFRKPEEAFSRHVLEALGLKPEETVMIGDSPFDIDAARCIGMSAFCVTTGSHQAHELLAHEPKPDGVFGDLYALGESVFGYKPSRLEMIGPSR